MTVMKMSKYAKILPQKSRQALLEFIKGQICPKLEYNEWREMEKDLSELKENVNRFMMEGIMSSLGKDLPENSKAEEIFKEDIRKLDDSVREEMKKVDLNKLKENLPKDEMNKLTKIFDMVFKAKE